MVQFKQLKSRVITKGKPSLECKTSADTALADDRATHMLLENATQRGPALGQLQETAQANRGTVSK